MSGLGHNEIVRAEFSKQAASFEDPDYLFADPRLMRWILQHVPARSGWTAIDVAGGTGHLARALAAQVHQVVVLDLTAAMLEQGKRQADAAGIDNVLFEHGDVAALPYVRGSFDLVASRFAFHHFEHPHVALGEMARVCRPGGRVAVIDLIAADAALAHGYNELERLRDPSHATALMADDMQALFQDAGLSVLQTASHNQAIDLERWLSQAKTEAASAERIRAELEQELQGGPATGMRPLLKKGKLCFTQLWMIFVAEKAAGSS